MSSLGIHWIAWMPHPILRIIYSLNILENISREHVRKSTPLWCQFTVLSMFSHRLLPFLNKIASFYLTPSRFVDCRWKKERWMGRFTYSITHLQMKNDWWHLIKPLFFVSKWKNQRYEGISFFCATENLIENQCCVHFSVHNVHRQGSFKQMIYDIRGCQFCLH